MNWRYWARALLSSVVLFSVFSEGFGVSNLISGGIAIPATWIAAIQLEDGRLRRLEENKPEAFNDWVMKQVERSYRKGKSIPGPAAWYLSTEATKNWALAAGYSEECEEVRKLEGDSRSHQARLVNFPRPQGQGQGVIGA